MHDRTVVNPACTNLITPGTCSSAHVNFTSILPEKIISVNVAFSVLAKMNSEAPLHVTVVRYAYEFGIRTTPGKEMSKCTVASVSLPFHYLKFSMYSSHRSLTPTHLTLI